MILNKWKIYLCAVSFYLVINGITFGPNTDNLPEEKQEYNQEQTRVKSFIKSLNPGQVNDLKNYETFADQVQSKWSQRNKEYSARLMLEICKPLSSGNFKEDRRYELARKYALSVLAEPNEIQIELELKLIGHVVTLMIVPSSPEGQKWVQIRKRDVEVRLHAWKRLIDAVDPDWNPNEELYINVPPPVQIGLHSGVGSESVKDPNLRAEYEEAIENNRKKIERFSRQYRLHKWLKKFPRYAEPYIIRAYSKPPYNLEELKRNLNKYLSDEFTKTRIVDAVTKNIEKQSQDMSDGSDQEN